MQKMPFELSHKYGCIRTRCAGDVMHKPGRNKQDQGEIQMNITLKQKDFEFLTYLADRELTLTQISQELGITKWDVQRVFDNLQEAGMIKSKKKGRERLVKITKNGEYFRDFYLKQKRKKNVLLGSK
jgi:predicted transcriptional regulator